MNTKRAAFVTSLLAIAAALLLPAPARADGPVTLKSAPALSPATLAPGKDATVTVEVSTSKEAAKVVQLQVRLGTQVIGTLAGEPLGANKTGKYSVKIAVPADASGLVTLAIWGQGLLIGNVTTRVGGAAPVMPLENKLMVASAATVPKIEMRAEQVRSLAVDASVIAGSSAQGTVTLEAPARVAGTGVSLTSSSPAVSVPQSVRVAGGSAAATFEIMAVHGGAPGNVTISAVVAGPGGVAKLATLRVWGREQVQSVQKMPEGCPEGRGSGEARPLAPGDRCQVNVALDSRTGEGARVNLSSSRADVTVPASVAIGPGTTRGTFLATVAPGAGGGTATITAVADRPGGVPKQLTLALADPPAPPAGQVTSLVLPGVVEPGLTYNGTVRLDGPAGPGGVTVVLNSSSPAVAVPSTVSVPAGAPNASFTARIGPTPPAGDVTLSAARSGPGNSVISLRLKVRMIQVADVKFDADGYGKWLLFLGSTSPASVTLDAVSITDVTVSLGSSNVAAAVPASVTIPAGQTRAAFTVSAAPGAQPGDATISAVRSGPGNASIEKALRIKVNQVHQVFFNPGEVEWRSKAGDTSHSSAPLSTPGTVTLEAPAALGGVSVALTTNESIYGVSVPASVFVPAGQSRVAFTATVGTELKQGGESGSRSSAPVTAVRSGQPASEAKTGNLSIVWIWRH